MHKDSLLFFSITFIIRVMSDSKSFQCNAYCKTMVHYNCTICVNDCSGQNNSKFTMISCNNIFCDSYAQDSCINYKSNSLNESMCIQTCCKQPSFTLFTSETLSQCSETNYNLQSNENLAGIIVYCVIFSITLTFIFGSILRCIKYCKKRAQNNRNQANNVNQNQIIVNNRQNNQGLGISSHQNNDRNQEVSHNDTFQQIEQRNAIKFPPNQSWVQDHQLSKKQTKSKDKSQARQVSCPICLQNQCECLTNCKHMFHFICLEEWTKRHQGCPICRNQNLDPFKIYCTTCHKKYFNYVYKGNNGMVYLAFIHSKKITCDKCQRQKQGQKNIWG